VQADLVRNRERAFGDRLPRLLPGRSLRPAAPSVKLVLDSPPAGP
jgi:hypothetical protein